METRPSWWDSAPIYPVAGVFNDKGSSSVKAFLQFFEDFMKARKFKEGYDKIGGTRSGKKIKDFLISPIN